MIRVRVSVSVRVRVRVRIRIRIRIRARVRVGLSVWDRAGAKVRVRPIYISIPITPTAYCAPKVRVRPILGLEPASSPICVAGGLT